MKRHKIKIIGYKDDLVGHRYSVLMDGVELKGVTGCHFDVTATEFARVKLTLLTDDFDIEGPVLDDSDLRTQLQIAEETIAALRGEEDAADHSTEMYHRARDAKMHERVRVINELHATGHLDDESLRELTARDGK